MPDREREGLSDALACRQDGQKGEGMPDREHEGKGSRRGEG